jgi:hypothetical protein
MDPTKVFKTEIVLHKKAKNPIIISNNNTFSKPLNSIAVEN